MEKLYKTGEAARFLNVSTVTIRRWVTAGKLEPIWINGQMRFRESELLNMMQNPSTPAEPVAV